MHSGIGRQEKSKQQMHFNIGRQETSNFGWQKIHSTFERQKNIQNWMIIA